MAGSGCGGPGSGPADEWRGACSLEGGLWGLQSLQPARTGPPSPGGSAEESCHQPPRLGLTLLPAPRGPAGCLTPQTHSHSSTQAPRVTKRCLSWHEGYTQPSSLPAVSSEHVTPKARGHRGTEMKYTGSHRSGCGRGSRPADALPSPLQRMFRKGAAKRGHTRSAWQPGSQPDLSQTIMAGE